MTDSNINEFGKLDAGVLHTWRGWANAERARDRHPAEDGSVRVNAKYLLSILDEIEAGRLGSGERDLHAEHVEGLRSTISDMLAEGDGKPTGSLSGAVCAIRELREMSDRNGFLADRNAKERDQAIKERDATREDLQKVCDALVNADIHGGPSFEWGVQTLAKHRDAARAERDAAREELNAIRDFLRSKVVPYEDSSTLEYAQMLATNRDFWWQSFSDTINERNKVMEERDALKARLELERDQIRVERDLARSQWESLAQDLGKEEERHRMTCSELLEERDSERSKAGEMFNALIGISNRVSSIISDDYEYPEVVEPTEEGILGCIEDILNANAHQVVALQKQVAVLDGSLTRSNLRMLKLLDMVLKIGWGDVEDAGKRIAEIDQTAAGDLP